MDPKPRSWCLQPVTGTYQPGYREYTGVHGSTSTEIHAPACTSICTSICMEKAGGPGGIGSTSSSGPSRPTIHGTRRDVAGTYAAGRTHGSTREHTRTEIRAHQHICTQGWHIHGASGRARGHWQQQQGYTDYDTGYKASDHPEAKLRRSTIGGHSSKAPGTAHKSPWSMSQTGP